MSDILLMILGGLMLFLYGMNHLAETAQQWSGENTKQWILRFTHTTISAVAVGTFITAVLDSSSAVIILVIVLTEAKLLTVKQSLGLVLGANIGTTISSQLIAVDVGKYASILMSAGLLMLWLAKNQSVENIGKSILFLGMLFFGLFIMEEAVEPIKHHQVVFDWLAKSQTPIIGTGIGALVTLVMQSSSATVGMAIVLVKQQILSVTGGIAIMMGAELGTVADTLIATIGRSSRALKVGLFHLLFNLISILIGLLLFKPFYELVTWISGQATPERVLANAHTLFNILGVVGLGWVVWLIQKSKWWNE